MLIDKMAVCTIVVMQLQIYASHFAKELALEGSFEGEFAFSHLFFPTHPVGPLVNLGTWTTVQCVYVDVAICYLLLAKYRRRNVFWW